jgi:hypothetical protein
MHHQEQDSSVAIELGPGTPGRRLSALIRVCTLHVVSLSVPESPRALGTLECLIPAFVEISHCGMSTRSSAVKSQQMMIGIRAISSGNAVGILVLSIQTDRLLGERGLQQGFARETDGWIDEAVESLSSSPCWYTSSYPVVHAGDKGKLSHRRVVSSLGPRNAPMRCPPHFLSIKPA